MSVTPESVKELLNSDDFGKRLQAVNAMRSLEPAIAFELVQPAIVDPHDRVRYSAVSLLATVGNENREKSLAILRDRLLNDPEADVQAAAADSLGGLKLQESFDDLKQVYEAQTDSWIIRLSIIAALGELGEPRAFDLVKTALSDSNELVQTTAIVAMGELGNPEAIPLIASYISHPDWQIRYRAVQSLSQFEGEEAHKALEVLAKDSVEQVAQAARVCLQS